jgi:thioredoxin 1
MSSEHIRKLTEENFEDEIGKGVTLVDFYADWCGPCRMLAPVLEKVAKEVSGKATIAKLDIDHAQKIASGFQVTSIPTLILFKDGKEVGRLIGLRDAEAVKEFILSPSASA